MISWYTFYRWTFEFGQVFYVRFTDVSICKERWQEFIWDEPWRPWPTEKVIASKHTPQILDVWIWEPLELIQIHCCDWNCSLFHFTIYYIFHDSSWYFTIFSCRSQNWPRKPEFPSARRSLKNWVLARNDEVSELSETGYVWDSSLHNVSPGFFSASKLGTRIARDFCGVLRGKKNTGRRWVEFHISGSFRLFIDWLVVWNIFYFPIYWE